MIKRFIKKILAKIYLIGKVEAEKNDQRLYQQKLSNETIIDETTAITSEALIANLTKVKSNLVVGKKCLIRGDLLVYNFGGQILIGDYVFIGPGSKIWSAKKITIGNRVLIAHNVNIHDNNSHVMDSKLRHEEYKYMMENMGNLKKSDFNEKEIIIEDDVWIGFNSSIMKGVRIGCGSIIGAGTIVTKDIPPYSVVVGNPATIIKKSE